MASFPWARFSVAAAGLVGFGYVLMKVTVPTEEELYNALAPDLKRKVDASRAARIAREEAAKRQADVKLNNPDPDAVKPIWAKDRDK